MIISFADAGRDMLKSTVNFFLSSMRKHVEQAFGILVKRWDIYKAGLDMSLAFAQGGIERSLLLHNWLIENVRDVTGIQKYTN